MQQKLNLRAYSVKKVILTSKNYSLVIINQFKMKVGNKLIIAELSPKEMLNYYLKS